MYSSMAVKLFNRFFFFLLVSLVANSSSFASSFENLEVLQKGDNTKGINEIKTFLKRFGYLEALDESDNNETLELAIKTYQSNFNIEATGRVDAQTLAEMRTTRCGVPDIIKGKNFMNLSSSGAMASGLSVQSQWVWPSSKMHLTYKFLNDYPEVARLPVELAFKKWAGVTKFTFSEVKGAEISDLTIGFFKGDHGDQLPFDGRGGKTLAHAFFPPDGRFHYDIEKRWFYLFRTNDAYDLWSVALHEIGHLLGLQHSSDKNAVMYPTFYYGESKDLNDDDIQKIRDLYPF